MGECAINSMKLNQHLYDVIVPLTDQVDVELICMGIGYTAVATSNGCIGVAYTYFDHKHGCSLIQDYQDFEGRPARDLLGLIRHQDALDRSMALALINALNSPRINQLPNDKDNDLLFDRLNISTGTKVSMVGFFKPLMGVLASHGADVEVIDEFRAMGNKDRFYHNLGISADVALITSTTILNSTLEQILAKTGDHVKVALLGPSTPMVAEAFVQWPMVKALAGIIPSRNDMVLKSVRHGLGTRHLHRYSRKVTLTL